MSLAIQTTTVPLHEDAHGVWRVGNTRISLESVLYAFKDGSSAEEILMQYPLLDLADIYAVLSWYLRNNLEADNYLTERKMEWEQLRSEAEERFNTASIRERLLGRAGKSTS